MFVSKYGVTRLLGSFVGLGRCNFDRDQTLTVLHCGEGYRSWLASILQGRPWREMLIELRTTYVEALYVSHLDDSHRIRRN